MSNNTRIIFTQGGKGGVGKTEFVLSLIPWMNSKGQAPLLLDFDMENTHKSGLKNFFPKAEKFDVHAEGALDRFFDICDDDDTCSIIADLGSGAGSATYAWFDEVYEDAQALGIQFTAVGVTTNEAGSVQSVLKWAKHLQRRADYLVVLNEMRDPNSKFEYWHDEEAVGLFLETLSPQIITMKSRIQDLQAELRNHTTTLQQIIDGDVELPTFRITRNLVRARSYQRSLFAELDRVADILLPQSS